jgi:hypothetical protein
MFFFPGVEGETDNVDFERADTGTLRTLDDELDEATKEPIYNSFWSTDLLSSLVGYLGGWLMAILTTGGPSVAFPRRFPSRSCVVVVIAQSQCAKRRWRQSLTLVPRKADSAG